MKTLNKVLLTEVGILPSDILNKKAQKHILGGERQGGCYSDTFKDAIGHQCWSWWECESGGSDGWWCYVDSDGHGFNNGPNTWCIC